MYFLFKPFLLVGLLMFVSACQSLSLQTASKREQSHKALSQWYVKPPKSTDSELYGVAEGQTQQDAIAHALSDIVARLNVSIASSFRFKSVVREGVRESVDREYVDEIKSEVQKITISNYELLESQKLGFKRYAVLVKVDKKAFAEALKKELQRDFFTLKSIKKAPALNALEKLRLYREKLQALQDLQNKLAVLSVLQKGFSQEKYLKQYEVLKQEYEALRRKISFWIYANYAPLREPLKKGLSAEHFHLKKERSKEHFDIDVQADIQKAVAYGFILARAHITINTKDYHGNVIATNSFSLTGRSTQGFHMAKQDLLRALNQKVQDEGIAKVLNLHI
jgi:hypothetical protein